VTAPKIVPRAEHTVSRRDIDPDALRVLQRLYENQYTAYLVGGSVRDLLLGRRPKDFDIGTDAHPYEIKKLFRNCWIIGRRFRLAHVKFGTKTIEVATFRQNVAEPGPTVIADPADSPPEMHDPIIVHSAEPPEVDGNVDPSYVGRPVLEGAELQNLPDQTGVTSGFRRSRRSADEHGIVRRDNVYGTPEEDAFRRDFTVNALFYDIATQSVIDFTGGLEDLQRRRIVSIGDPNVRFKEDPVRMLRAAVFGARLDFELDDAVLDAIEQHGDLIQKASPARLMEEYYKILRSGYAEATFRTLDGVGLLEKMTPELADPPDSMWASLAKLDAWRRQHPSMPAEMVNPVLIGALLVPLGIIKPHTALSEDEKITLGILPVPRKDLDRLRFLLLTVPKLIDPNLPPRVAKGLPGRPSFSDALTWLEIFGNTPETAAMVAQWKLVKPEPRPEPQHSRRGSHQRHGHQPGHAPAPHSPLPGDGPHTPGAPGSRRRRRRRGRGRRGGGPPAA
jgi:poly(A) polymerase